MTRTKNQDQLTNTSLSTISTYLSWKKMSRGNIMMLAARSYILMSQLTHLSFERRQEINQLLN